MGFRPRRLLVLLAAGEASSTTADVARRTGAQAACHERAVAPHAGMPAPEPSTSAAAPHVEMLDELERLTRLRESGVLTHEEFTAAKSRVIGL